MSGLVMVICGNFLCICDLLRKFEALMISLLIHERAHYKPGSPQVCRTTISLSHVNLQLGALDEADEGLNNICS